MAQVSRTTAKSYFNTGDTPTEAQFANFIESAAWFDDAVALTVNGIAPVSGNIVLTTENVADSSNKRYVTDADLLVLAATSGTNTGDQDLSGLLVKSANLSDLTNAGIARTNLGLGTLATQSGTFSGTSSGTNTGDEDQASIKTKLGAASGSQDGYLTSGNWTTFNNKQDLLVSGTNIKSVNGNSLLGSGNLVISGSGNTFTSGLTEASGTVTNDFFTGKAGGQTLIGGTGANEDLNIQGTSHGTRATSYVTLQKDGGFVGVGTATPESTLHVSGGGVTTCIVQSSSKWTSFFASSGGDPAIYWNTGNNMRFGTSTTNIGGGFTTLIQMNSSGAVGIGQTSPTAILHLKAGTATANTAPLKLTSGTNLSTPENGAFEFDGTNLYFTTGGVRKTVNLT